MNERWKMNRIGFVNFWLYDEEDFEFEDGKLLLRGQNGSGKSIAAQGRRRRLGAHAALLGGDHRPFPSGRGPAHRRRRGRTRGVQEGNRLN